MHIFETIGRIGDYAQMKNLQRDMRHRLRTGQSLAQALGAPQDPRKTMSRALLPPTGESDGLRTMRIRQKLRQGQKLSGADMQYLKENDPDLYEKVSRIEERREELARALKRAKTKDEAIRAVTLANIAVLSELRATGGAEAPSLRGAMQGSVVGAAAGVSSAGEAAAAPGDGADMPSADMPAEPSAAEMNAAIAGEALAEGGGTDAAAPDANASVQEPLPEGTSADEAPRTPGGRRILSSEEKVELRRFAVEGSKRTPLDNEHVYLLRAYQREWMQYANSDAYKELPDTPLDAAKADRRAGKRRRTAAGVSAPAPSAAEILAAAQRYYHTAQAKDIFVARG